MPSTLSRLPRLLDALLATDPGSADADDPDGGSVDAVSDNDPDEDNGAASENDDRAPGPDDGDGRRLLAGVVGVAVAATAMRLYALGQRVAYFDEAWVGYWVLRTNANGVWRYRPIVHGPFFFRVNGPVFAAFGATDVTARLVVALVGGLAPLAAWLFRERLSAAETAVTALLLAGTPVLVYYSRFMRNDVLLGVFALVAVGFGVRFADTAQPRYLYAAAFAFGLSLTTKESALLYVPTWLGAGALVADRRLLTARLRDGRDARTTAVRTLKRTATAGRRLFPHLVGAVVVFLAVVVYFYAPRTPPGEPGFRTMASSPGTIPAVVGEATLGSLEKAVDLWVSGSIQGHPYLPYLLDTLRTLGAGGLAVVVLAPVGFLVDRHGPSSRDLVGFMSYSGGAAVVGYPLANNFPVPWSTVHALVPLAVPAAVGAVAVGRWGVAGVADNADSLVGRSRPAAPDGGSDSERGSSRALGVLRAAVVALLLGGLALQGAATVVETSYDSPHDSASGDTGNEVVYYAQAPADLRTVTEAIRRAAADGDDDLDVLYVGRPVAAEESKLDAPPATTAAFFARNPLLWYTEASGATVGSVFSPADIDTESPPPVVVTTQEYREEVRERLPESYDGRRYRLDEIGDRTVVVFLRSSGEGAD